MGYAVNNTIVLLGLTFVGVTGPAIAAILHYPSFSFRATFPWGTFCFKGSKIDHLSTNPEQSQLEQIDNQCPSLLDDK
jgi:hypothetical protein